MNAHLQIVNDAPHLATDERLELRTRALMLSLSLSDARKMAGAGAQPWPSQAYVRLAGRLQREASNYYPSHPGGLNALLDELRGLGDAPQARRLASLLFDFLSAMPVADHVLARRLIREVDLLVYREFASRR